MIRSNKNKQETKQKEKEIKEKEKEIKEKEKLQKEKEKEREKESKKANIKEASTSHTDSTVKVSTPLRNDPMLRSFRKGYVEMRYRNSWKYIYVILIGGSFYMYHNSTVRNIFSILLRFCFFLLTFFLSSFLPISYCFLWISFSSLHYYFLIFSYVI